MFYGIIHSVVVFSVIASPVPEENYYHSVRSTHNFPVSRDALAVQHGVRVSFSFFLKNRMHVVAEPAASITLYRVHKHPPMLWHSCHK
jgi:hypothetical protein